MIRNIMILLAVGAVTYMLCACAVKPDLSYYYNEGDYIDGKKTVPSAGSSSSRPNLHLNNEVRYYPQPVKGSHYNYLPAYR